MLGWEVIKIILKKRDHSLTYKALSAKTPQYLSNLFTVSSNNTYQLRCTGVKLYLQKPKTNFLKKRLSCRGATSWNKLLNEITSEFTHLSEYSLKSKINDYYKNRN